MAAKDGNKGEAAPPPPDQRGGSDRRSAERRKRDVSVSRERRSGQERRKTVRRINEYVMEPDVLEFINAVNEYKSVNQKPFPTWSEIYKIFVALGYRKTAGD